MKNNRKRSIRKKLGVCSLALFLLLGCIACGVAASEPTIAIVGPANPTAGDVTISADVNGLDPMAQGKFIYYMDVSVPVYYAHSAVSKAGTYAISTETTYTWTDVTPGEHKFSIQLVDKNNSPLPSPVVDSITIQVNAPDKAPQIDITNLTDGDTLPPGNILVTAGISDFIVSQDDIGVLIRAGEGHLIYYIDEDPPTDQGVPATTDTSMVSVSENHLWKNVTEGQHTFSVQLVNNDDTPLETLAFAIVTIDVKP